MLDVDTEAQLLEDAPLRLDHLVLQINVVLVQHQGVDGSVMGGNKVTVVINHTHPRAHTRTHGQHKQAQELQKLFS